LGIALRSWDRRRKRWEGLLEKKSTGRCGNKRGDEIILQETWPIPSSLNRKGFNAAIFKLPENKGEILFGCH